MSTQPVIDLDARRAARREAQGEGPVVKLGGKDFTLPAELPLTFIELLTENDFRGSLDILFGVEAAADFVAEGATMEDLLAIVETYGVSLGEASASQVSSPNGGPTPRRTSRGTTR